MDNFIEGSFRQGELLFDNIVTKQVTRFLAQFSKSIEVPKNDASIKSNYFLDRFECGKAKKRRRQGAGANGYTELAFLNVAGIRCDELRRSGLFIATRAPRIIFVFQRRGGRM